VRICVGSCLIVVVVVVVVGVMVKCYGGGVGDG
jgi:hypothetical protein